MNVFSTVRNSFGAFLSPRKQSQPEVAVWEDNVDEEEATRNESSIRNASPEEFENDVDLEGETLLVEHAASKKRAYFARSDGTPAKRQKTKSDDESPNDFEGDTLLSSTPAAKFKFYLPQSKSATDRVLMPPPAVPWTSKEQRTSAQSVVEDDVSEIDSIMSGVGSKRMATAVDDFDIEQSRRNAEAIQLPANSGVWAQAEKDLFYHLALRGFEPLLPENWMIDFRTLPLSLYAREGSRPPLISAQYEAEFRAIRALRDLINLGQNVRDRALTRRKLQAEPAIERGIHKYMSWALRDVGMHPSQRPSVIPAHAITTMGKGQTTQDAIQELTGELHSLATRWRRAHNIRESVEARSATPVSNEETQIAEDDENGLPILTGILICSSLMMIVTLNAHTPPPAFLTGPAREEDYVLSPRSSPSDIVLKTEAGLDRQAPAEPSMEDSGLRVIATFDFSDARQDVWNALAVAIVAMCTRNTLVAQFEAASRAGRGVMWETAEQKGPAVQGNGLDDPDA